MKPAATEQKAPRGYQKHGDSYRQRLLKERGTDAIDGRTRAGKRAKAWGADAIKKKGAKACPVDVKELIEDGEFYLWRALKLREYIIADARKRGTPINRRTGRLPKVNEQYDAAMVRWQGINDRLELDKPLDLARRLMYERQAKENGATP